MIRAVQILLFQPVKGFFDLPPAGIFSGCLFDTAVDGTGFNVKPAELLQDRFLVADIDSV